MSERYLESLAILLAGLFSAEAMRVKRISLGLLASPEKAPASGDAASAPAKPH